MISALIYLQVHACRNRLVNRFKRLKQPKYLAGAIVGGLYFYFYFYRYLFGVGGRHPALSLASVPEQRLLVESLGALGLFVVVFLAWVVPQERAALGFSEAEVAFLFPVPVHPCSQTTSAMTARACGNPRATAAGIYERRG